MTSGLPDWHRSVRLTGKYGIQLLPVLVDDKGNLYAVIKGFDGTQLRTVKLDADGTILAKLTGGTVDVGKVGTMSDKDRNVRGYDGATYRAIAVDSDGIMLARLKGYDGTQLRDVLIDEEGRIVGVFKGRYSNLFDLVLDLPFDEGSGSVVYDQSLYGNNGTIYGASWVKGYRGWGLSFDGVDDYVEIPHSNELNCKHITIAAWFYPMGVTGWQVILTKNTGGVSRGYHMAYDAYYDNFRFSFWDDSGTEHGFDTPRNYPSGDWYFFVATYDEEYVRLYVNAEKVLEQGETTPIGYVSSNILIGQWGGGTQPFEGVIDEVRIYNRALSDEEIKELYQGKPTLRVDRNGNLSAILYARYGNLFKPVQMDSLQNLKINISGQDLSEILTGIRTYQAESVEWIIASSTDTLPSNDYESVFITPPEGYIYELIGLNVWINNPPGATSGHHSFALTNYLSDVDCIYARSNYNTPLWFDANKWVYADDEQRPSDESAIVNAIRGWRADPDNGFEFFYINNTNVDQTNGRFYKVVVRKIKVS